MTFNPNGNNWVNSDSMGKQLLMKAGWSKGEGIGKNKQGTNVHIKVSIKNEKDGIGFKTQQRQSDMSLMQCFTFDNILKSKYGKPEINNEEEDEINKRSLSRARFGRAVPKDFFKPVQSDELNKILCKSNLEKKENIEEIPIVNHQDFDRNANFTSSYSVFEYFSMKMKNSKVKIRNFSGYFCEKTEVLQNYDEEKQSKKRKIENEDSSEVIVKRSKTADIEITDQSGNESINTIKKKKKKNKGNDETIESTLLARDEENTIEENQKKSEENVKKSKRKSKSKNCESSAEINSELIVVKEETNSKKKKRKIEVEEVDNCKISELEIVLSDNKKKKKSKRIDIGNEESPNSERVISKNTSVVPSVEIIDNKTICPWDSCNLSAIEGYKYY